MDQENTYKVTYGVYPIKGLRQLLQLAGPNRGLLTLHDGMLSLVKPDNSEPVFAISVTDIIEAVTSPQNHMATLTVRRKSGPDWYKIYFGNRYFSAGLASGAGNAKAVLSALESLGVKTQNYIP